MKKFNIRVYGILEQDDSYLLSTEQIDDFKFTKFPGGGLEHGEGTIDCLKREFNEELDINIDIDIVKHLYTTDFYQQSAFNTNDQIISIYYKVTTNSRIEFEPQIISKENPYRILDFYWKKKEELLVEDLTFPIDKLVAKMLI